MTEKIHHISVCVCTFKRRAPLRRLLSGLDRLATEGLFTYSVVIADNDAAKSAESVVNSFQRTSKLEIRYCVEPEQNIALARNKAVENAKGSHIAFIDDDELPPSDWLLQLFRASLSLAADGILGPVLPLYESDPPAWVLKGRFYERPSHKTGTILDWLHTRTGNVLLRRNIFDDPDNWFRAEFGRGGEDRDFFRRIIEKGCKFVWCAEAPVFEVVPPNRYERSFMLKRALLLGAKTPYTNEPLQYIKSFVAVLLYSTTLPVLALIAQHCFMKVLMKGLDHAGLLLTLCGINPVKERYIVS
jgi:glycosyltransferase involved in cell wall biosynthesis